MKASSGPAQPDPSFSNLNRREALKSLLGMTAALMTPDILGAVASASPPAPPPLDRDRFGELLPQRKLGRQGPMVTMLGLGGAHIGFMAHDAMAQKTIESAIAGGIRYFDTAAGYAGGQSEVRYGKFLTPKYREHVLIFTKTMAEDAATARSHLEGSLQRMKTDYLDLWQLHDMRTIDKATERVHGVLDVMLKAKAEGKVRHIGFTGHGSWKTHAHVLGMTDAFETCLADDYKNESEDLSIIACGPMVPEAMRAALILKRDYGYETRVLNMHTLKPIDTEAVIRAAQDTGVVITAEEHQIGALAWRVSGILTESKQLYGKPLITGAIGVKDRFGDSGSPWEMVKELEVSAEHIAQRAVELMKIKKK